MTGTSVKAEGDRAGVGIPFSSYTGAGIASSSHRDCCVYRGFFRCGYWSRGGGGGGGRGFFGAGGRESASGGGLGAVGRMAAASFTSEASLGVEVVVDECLELGRLSLLPEAPHDDTHTGDDEDERRLSRH